MEEGFYMTTKELSRAELFARIKEKRLTQIKAAEILNLSLRQVQRLYAGYKQAGVKALISKKRGKPSNNRLPDLLKTRILELVTCEAYTGFGPTFMHEKLAQYHGITISVEALRQLMILSEVWKSNQKGRPIVHQQRLRRARSGELVQIDGSHHAWFENRARPCVLIVFIDDATGRIHAKFFESETTAAYLITTWEYIEKYGRMRAVYPDRHGIFRVNTPGCPKKDCLTQYGRALKELDIELICANSPQAKGRVERANKTLQDRLIKELRLAGISTIEEANVFLPGFLEEYNGKFSRQPRDARDAHRELLTEQHLERVLCVKDLRKVSKNLEIQYENVIYQLEGDRLRGVVITVLKGVNDNSLRLEYKGKELTFKVIGEQEYQGRIVTSKEIDRFFRTKQIRQVASHHPWKQEGKATARKKQYMAL